MITPICLTLGTRAGLEPQRGGKAVTVLPLVMGWNILHRLPVSFSAGYQMTALELETLRNAAMTLSEKERAALAKDLVASLDGPEDEGVAEAWDREIRRRIQQIDSGEVELLDAKEVLSRARDRIRG